MKRIFALISGFVFALSFVGCNNQGAGLYEVTGEVYFNGELLDQGTIRFDPDDPQTSSGGGATIEKGKYTIPKERGLKPGHYTIRVSSGNPEKMERPKEAPGEARPVAEDRIPPTWNVASTNKVEVVVGKNTFSHRIP